MSSDDDAPDWSGALLSARQEADEEEDDEGINVVSQEGLSGSSAAADSGPKELPYVILLRAAVSAVKSGEISVEQYVDGVKKLDAIADQALKVYDIPAVKKDLPGKLTDYQNQIVLALEEQIHNLKEGLGLMLAYPQSKSIQEMEEGMQISIDALNASHQIRQKADAEREAIRQQEQDEKAKRIKKAAESDS